MARVSIRPPRGLSAGNTIQCTDGTMDCYTDAYARQLLANAGISVVSSGGCSNKNNRRCTSLQQIHRGAIDGPSGVLTLKRVSGCSMVVTGGTEVGHSAGKSRRDPERR
jgi:tartrate dehydratase beta subunit/fumarate hydratase class I family protein